MVALVPRPTLAFRSAFGNFAILAFGDRRKPRMCLAMVPPAQYGVFGISVLVYSQQYDRNRVTFSWDLCWDGVGSPFRRHPGVDVRLRLGDGEMTQQS